MILAYSKSRMYEIGLKALILAITVEFTQIVCFSLKK